MSDETIQRLGDEYISGIGVEIGAGLQPRIHPGADTLLFLDKRDAAAFERHFGQPPPYALTTHDEVRSAFPQGIDFVAAHQVAEHLDDPIRTIARWIDLLRPGGLLFLSVPSRDNPMETTRLATPTDHLIEDFAFARPATSYESRQHIYSFVSACAAMENELSPWYAQGNAAAFARRMLYEARELDEHDLHWHTFTARSLADSTEIAFAVAGYSGERLRLLEADHALIALYRKSSERRDPEALVRFRARLRDSLALVDGILIG